MRVLAVVAIVAFVAVASAADIPLSDEQKMKVRLYSKECITETGTTPEAVHALRQGNFAGADDKQKCFAKCFIEKTGMWKDGKIQDDVILMKLGSVDNINGIMETCNSLKGADDCDTAFKLYECYYNNHAGLM